MPRSISDKLESPGVVSFVRVVVRNDACEVAKLISATPSLAQGYLAVGAARKWATGFSFKEINHYLYAGDTPLHAAAATYRIDIARALIKNGAEIAARNRRGAEPLHYAADGLPGSSTWNPLAQAEMITLLINAGANPNALDKSGAAPLHRAVRQRCPGAVNSLLRNGASVRLKNKSGSTPLHLAVQTTGRGGTGSPESKLFQREIIALLLKACADPRDKDGQGKTARQCTRSDWIRALL